VLATDLSVSRNTVLNAFEQLAAEGYLVGSAGGGTRICHGLPDDLPPMRVVTAPATFSARGRRRPSRRASSIVRLPFRHWRDGPQTVRPFRSGTGAIDSFPVKDWMRLIRRSARDLRSLMNYGDVGGYRPLRLAIAEYLKRARGLTCEPDQVLIVNGSQQGLDLAARLLLDPGDAAWLEDPGYDGALAAIGGAGARIAPVPVDEDGLNVAAGVRRCPDARLAYVTPSHQFPLGVTMSLTRRFELLSWAQRSGAWIVEDDYDSDLRYAARPLPALQGLDSGGCVIYAGTFSKILFPALRLGYLVIPQALVETFRRLRLSADIHPPTFLQGVLAAFIREGHFARHIRRMRTLYRERHDALIFHAGRFLGGFLDVQPTETGMHVVGWLPAQTNDNDAAHAAQNVGIDVMPVSFFARAPLPRRGLLLGFAAFAPEEIAQGMEKLATALSGGRSPCSRRSLAPST
jgi:GntR family transcriptional regulator/MocR family aminotransferase